MLNKLEYVGQRVAQWMNERTQFGVAPNSSSVETLIKDHQVMSSLYHYEAYDPDHQLFLNKSSQGFILEASPLTGASEETINILAGMITDSLPQESDLQFLLWSSSKIGAALDKFEARRSGCGEIFEWLAKKRTDFLKNGRLKSLTKHEPFIIRNFRLLIVVSKPSKRKEDLTEPLLQLREELISTFKSIGVPSHIVKVDEFKSMLNEWTNPSSDVHSLKEDWHEHTSLSLQLSDPEYSLTISPSSLLFESGEEKWEARSYTVKDFPKSMAQWKMMDSIGQLFNSALQIPASFIISFSLRLVDSEKAQLRSQFKVMDKEKTAKSPLAKFKPLIAKEYEDWSHVQHRLAEGDKLVKVFYQVISYSPPSEANNIERNIRNLYRANGWQLRRENYIQLQSWLSMLPMRMSEGMFEDLDHFGRLKTMTAFNAVNMAPLQGEWKGTSTPSLILPGRRGQLAYWNPFDNTEGNYNVAIAAASGKGKSMFTQEYITSLVGSGGRVWVIDIGRSYEKTCKLLGGSFIEFDPERQISLNPFTCINDFDASLVMLKPLLAAMARPSSRATDEEIAYLEKALKAAWSKEGNQASITTVAQWLNNQENTICKNLSHLLYSFTSDGMYGRYFEGTSNINLDSNFVVLELQELKAKKDLQKIILLVLMYQISEAMYLSDRRIYKSCVIDEAWDLLGGDNDGAAKFIETGYRTARRYNSNFVTITQSLNDYYKNETSLAALENSDYNIILGQKSETIDQLKKQDRLNLDAFTERLYKSLRKTDDYSECIIKSPSGLSVHRIIFDPYSRILFSSKGDEFEAVNSLVTQGLSLNKAIEHVARKFNHA